MCHCKGSNLIRNWQVVEDKKCMVQEADILLGCAAISSCTDFSVVLEKSGYLIVHQKNFSVKRPTEKLKNPIPILKSSVIEGAYALLH